MIPQALVQTVQASASLAACYLFASLYPDIRTVRTSKSTGKLPLLPLTSMFGNCVLWTLYGFLARDYFPLVATNGVGIGFSTFYLAVYYQYTPRKIHTQRTLLAMAAALLVVALYPVFSYEPRAVVQRRVGYLAIAVCAVMFGSPLVLVKQVVRTKNADVLPFGMIMAGLVNSLLWLTYGFILQDMIVLVPNLFNLCLGAIQLALILVYPRSTVYDKVDAEAEGDRDVELAKATKDSSREVELDETSSTDGTLSDV